MALSSEDFPVLDAPRRRISGGPVLLAILLLVLLLSLLPLFLVLVSCGKSRAVWVEKSGTGGIWVKSRCAVWRAFSDGGRVEV